MIVCLRNASDCTYAYTSALACSKHPIYKFNNNCEQIIQSLAAAVQFNIRQLSTT